jgi:hypothetical protein
VFVVALIVAQIQPFLNYRALTALNGNVQEVASVPEHQHPHEEQLTNAERNFVRDGARDIGRDPIRDEARDIEHDK